MLMKTIPENLSEMFITLECLLELSLLEFVFLKNGKNVCVLVFQTYLFVDALVSI